jgi:hypothetical protein
MIICYSIFCIHYVLHIIAHLYACLLMIYVENIMKNELGE